MPELPEVETVCRGLQQSITGDTIEHTTLRRKDLRIPFPINFAKAIAGRKILAITRRAKYLLFHLENGLIILAHLGMSGRFSVEKTLPITFSKHDHVIWHLADGRVVIYHDPRRFGLMTLLKDVEEFTHPLLSHLGPEPFSNAFNAEYLRGKLLKRSGPIKPALMDQKLVVGVGNIYASEVLFLCGIRPQTVAAKASKKAELIVPAIQKVLESAIKSGGSSLKDFVQISGESGYFQHEFKVYERAGEPCFTCHKPLTGIRQAGRSTFYCRHCQK